jgi:histidinol phosphatase-like PHP family hydrolase
MNGAALNNASLAELLARHGEEASGHLQRACKRASRLAFLWPEEAYSLVSQHRPLTELPGIGPHLARLLAQWLATPPNLPEPTKTRHGFLTLTDARMILSRHPTWLRKVKGDLQMHTTWSDGSVTVSEMAEAGVAKGYEYVAITDHSQGLKIAGGMNEAKLASQVSEIERVNRRFSDSGCKFHVLSSIEMNLNPDGAGDMSVETLASLNLVLGSFHSALRRTEDQTGRYLAALKNPSVHILGHPRGRIYNFRAGLNADWRRVFEVAASLDKAVEIDGFPDRQDLDVDLLRLARSTAVRVSLGTDAHRPDQLTFMEFSLAAAIQAEIPQERILNFMPVQDLIAWAKNR